PITSTLFPYTTLFRSFSSLADYVAAHPATFSRNFGNPVLDDVQVELGTFFQSDWKVTKSFNLSLGTRYETQTNISDHNNVDPRRSEEHTSELQSPDHR